MGPRKRKYVVHDLCGHEPRLLGYFPQTSQASIIISTSVISNSTITVPHQAVYYPLILFCDDLELYPDVCYTDLFRSHSLPGHKIAYTMPQTFYVDAQHRVGESCIVSSNGTERKHTLPFCPPKLIIILQPNYNIQDMRLSLNANRTKSTCTTPTQTNV